MKRMKTVLAMLIALIMVFSMVACGGAGADTPATGAPAADAPAADAPAADTPAADTPTEDAPKTLAELRVGTYNDTAFCSGFDPTGVLSGGVQGGRGQSLLVYDTLFYIDQTCDYTSRIVESHEWIDDTTLVVKLKDGIYFSNGMQLTGEDVFFSLQACQNGARRSGTYKPYDLSQSTISEDGLTMTFKTNAPYAAYYAGLDFPIYCKEYVESAGEGGIDWADPSQVVGSGPYICTALELNSSATYVKRDDYWGLEHGYDDIYESITITKYSDQATMFIDLETGALDLIMDMSLADYNRVMAGESEGLTAKLIKGNVVYQLVFDAKNNVYLQDAAVREALCHAIDTAAITTTIAGSFGEIADSMFAANEVGYKSGMSYEYNPEYAKQILAEAGYAEGEINLKFAYIGSEPYISLAEVLQAYFAEVGVNLTLEAYEMATFVSSANVVGFTDVQVYTMAGGNPWGEPTVHLDNWYPNSTSPVMRRDGEYYDCLVKGANSLDIADREAAYGRLQELWYENYDGVPLYAFNKGYAFRNDVFEDITLVSNVLAWFFDANLK